MGASEKQQLSGALSVPGNDVVGTLVSTVDESCGVNGLRNDEEDSSFEEENPRSAGREDCGREERESGGKQQPKNLSEEEEQPKNYLSEEVFEQPKNYLTEEVFEQQPNATEGSPKQQVTTKRSPQLVEVHVLGRHRRHQRKNNSQDVSLHTISTASGRLLDVRTSTVQNLQNRKTDKERVDKEVGLTEFGNTSTAIYYMDGDWLPETQYWDEYGDLHTNERPRDLNSNEENWIPTTLLAQGYNRIVYGDHGPYVELSDNQINWAAFPYLKEKPKFAYYDEYFTADGKTMLYAQKKFVTNKKNPPKVGAWSTNNNRPEGYANYVPGYYYIEASRAKLYCVDTRTGMDMGEDDENAESKLDENAEYGGSLGSDPMAIASAEMNQISRNLEGSVLWAASSNEDHQFTCFNSSEFAPHNEEGLLNDMNMLDIVSPSEQYAAVELEGIDGAVPSVHIDGGVMGRPNTVSVDGVDAPTTAACSNSSCLPSPPCETSDSTASNVTADVSPEADTTSGTTGDTIILADESKNGHESTDQQEEHCGRPTIATCGHIFVPAEDWSNEPVIYQ